MVLRLVIPAGSVLAETLVLSQGSLQLDAQALAYFTSTFPYYEVPHSTPEI